MPWHSKPHDAAPVYRCDDHWHFRPHKNDNHPTHQPRYLAKEASLSLISHLHSSDPKSLPGDNEGKFKLHAQPVYAQGQGDEEFVVSYKYASGFYQLQKSDWSYRWSSRCPGKYGGEPPKKLWRVEEISSTPWGRAQAVDDDEVMDDESLPSYEAPYQPPPSYGPPNRAPSQAHHSYGASDPAPYQPPPSYRAPYHAPPSNQPRYSHSPYSGRYRYENSR